VAIQYPSVGAIIFDKFPAGNLQECAENVEANLIAAGWTLEGTAASTVTLTMTGQPGDTQTLTLDGVVFTAKNTPSGANDFAIGATFQDTADNIETIVNANHPDVTASHNGSGVITFTYGTTGSEGFAKAASETMNNATLSAAVFSGGSSTLVCAATPDRLQMKLRIYSGASTSDLYFEPSAMDGVAKLMANPGYLTVATGRELTICANAHQCFIWLETDISSTMGQIACGVPYLRGAQKPLLITGAADNGSGEIRLTRAGHGLTTGETLNVADLIIDGQNISGTFTATVIDADTVDLDGSTYPGGSWSADTGTIGTNTGRISRAIWFLSFANGGFGVNGATWRSSPNYFIGGISAVGGCFGCVNQYYWDPGPRTQVTFHRLALPTDRSGNIYRNYGQYADAIEARIGWQIASPTSPFKWVGDLWAAIMIASPAAIEAEQVGFDGHDWVNYMSNAKCSLWLAKS
jgi:hypothetical protein